MGQIKKQGAATGWVDFGGLYTYHTILWSQSSGVTDLGTLTGGSNDPSQGYGISDNGQVVGWSTKNGSGSYAFVYSKATGMQDLNTLENGNWSVGIAYGINSAGQIIAWGATSGSTTLHALLLTPE